MRRGQRTIEQVKIKMALQIDDKTFQTMLIDTQVVQTKDHAKWDYNILVELFEGPLLNGKRTEEAFKLNKWGRKLIAFWNPTSRKFSDLPKRKVSGSCLISNMKGKAMVSVGELDSYIFIGECQMDQAWLLDSDNFSQNNGRDKVSAQ